MRSAEGAYGRKEAAGILGNGSVERKKTKMLRKKEVKGGG